MILFFLITNQNLKKENVMLERFQETFQSLFKPLSVKSLFL